MQFSESWLRSFVNPVQLSTDALSHSLTMAGLEVEEVGPVAPPFDKVVVARVLATERHPNADRLNVCQVDAGTGETLQIVCGAPNVKPGILVPCALVGAVLPPAEEGGLEGMEKWHAAKPASIVARRPAEEVAKSGGDKPVVPQYTTVFGNALVDECRRDERVVGITAAMNSGSFDGRRKSLKGPGAPGWT